MRGNTDGWGRNDQAPFSTYVDAGGGNEAIKTKYKKYRRLYHEVQHSLSR